MAQQSSKEAPNVLPVSESNQPNGDAVTLPPIEESIRDEELPTTEA
jgi:hypothetical protein